MDNSQQAYLDAHRKADTDNEPDSIHHTLGYGPNQAAPGSHGHTHDHDVEYAALAHNHDAAYAALAHNHQTPTDTWHTVGGAGEPAFLNSWAIQAGFPVKFIKDATGTVQIIGLIQGPNNGTAVFTLPVGYRPAQVIGHRIGYAHSNLLARIVVGTDGVVTVAAEAGYAWISVSMSFPIY